MELSLQLTPSQCSLYAVEIEVVKPQFQKGVVNATINLVKLLKVELVRSKFFAEPLREGIMRLRDWRQICPIRMLLSAETCFVYQQKANYTLECIHVAKQKRAS